MVFVKTYLSENVKGVKMFTIFHKNPRNSFGHRGGKEQTRNRA